MNLVLGMQHRFPCGPRSRGPRWDRGWVLDHNLIFGSHAPPCDGPSGPPHAVAVLEACAGVPVTGRARAASADPAVALSRCGAN